MQVPLLKLDGILAALKAGGNGKVESIVLPLLNHMFLTAVTGNEDEYGKIEETLAPDALTRIATFIAQQASP